MRTARDVKAVLANLCEDELDLPLVICHCWPGDHGLAEVTPAYVLIHTPDVVISPA